MPRRLTIREYADREGASEATVRRRIKRGELKAEKIDTAQGFHYEIVVDDDAKESEPPEQEPDHDHAPPSHPPTQNLITELRGTVDYLKQEIEDRKREHDRDRLDWRGELERLHTLMAQQGQTIQALTQRVEALPDPALTPEPQLASPTVLHTYISGLGGGAVPLVFAGLVSLVALVWKLAQGIERDSWLDVGAVVLALIALGLSVGFLAVGWWRSRDEAQKAGRELRAATSPQDVRRALERVAQAREIHPNLRYVDWATLLVAVVVFLAPLWGDSCSTSWHGCSIEEEPWQHQERNLAPPY